MDDATEQVDAALVAVRATLAELREALDDNLRASVGTLFVTDRELCMRLGVPESIARAAIQVLNDKDGTFPKKQKLWGNRRYWPAVVRWFDDHYGVVRTAPQKGR